MADNGTIRTIYKDEAHTEAIYPRTIVSAVTGAQPTLVSGTNIKTINSTSLLGSGNISIPTGNVSSSEASTIKVLTQTEYDAISSKSSTTLYMIKES